MRFRVASKLKYSVLGKGTLIFSVHALRSPSQTITDEKLLVTPPATCDEFNIQPGHNRFVRVEAGAGPEINIEYHAIVEAGHFLVPMKKLLAVPVGKLDPEALSFLFPSRYCQSDKLGRLAYQKFGSIRHPFRKVVAISDWIFENIEYVRGSTDSQTSAYDTVTERAGVCRDFAHLGIALCRALSIPARYLTGYAYQLEPPDFHACFEAYIGGRWLLFDPTRLVPLNGIVRIASGRDAADAAVATLFGPIRSKSMSVSCEAIDEGFEPINRQQLDNHGICLDPV